MGGGGGGGGEEKEEGGKLHLGRRTCFPVGSARCYLGHRTCALNNHLHGNLLTVALPPPPPLPHPHPHKFPSTPLLFLGGHFIPKRI